MVHTRSTAAVADERIDAKSVRTAASRRGTDCRNQPSSPLSRTIDPREKSGSVRSMPMAKMPYSPSATSSLKLLFSTARLRSDEHTSELQSLMRITYAVFCLKKKKNYQHQIKVPSRHSKRAANQ